jgi:hypothetical protein
MAQAAAPCTTTVRSMPSKLLPASSVLRFRTFAWCFQTLAAAGGGTATWGAWTAKRSGGLTTCGRGWAPSRSAAWSGTTATAASRADRTSGAAVTTGEKCLN